MNLTIKTYLEWIEKGEFTADEVVNQYLQKIQEKNSDFFAFVRIHEKYLQEHRENAEKNPLHGLPLAIKDNILLQGEISSCGSKMLENYTAPYTATCLKKLEEEGALFLGKTNMDEFAMGSSTETSYFGNTKNPHGENRIPGGSSGGSAAAVAADLCVAALWTDTWGSVRQPASHCGVVGLKPTYGRISRYGVQSMASSFDQVGTFTKTVEDARILLGYLAGKDKNDSQTGENSDSKDFLQAQTIVPSETKIAVPNEVFGECLDERVEKCFREKIEELKKQGFTVDFIDFPLLKEAAPIYYILISAEVTSNLSRFDGMRFGLQKEMKDFDSLDAYYRAIRTEGFGKEVKKRLLLGNYVVQKEHYDTYYKKAYEARKYIQKMFAEFFQNYQAILMPTSPCPAGKIGEKKDNSLLMYLEDLYTVPANIAWLPAISIPMGMIQEGNEELPVGIQLMGAWWKEGLLFDIAEKIELSRK